MFYKIDFVGCNMIAMSVIKLYHRLCRDELWHLDDTDVGHHDWKYILVYSHHILKTITAKLKIRIQDVELFEIVLIVLQQHRMHKWGCEGPYFRISRIVMIRNKNP